ncbi:hypothetical protein [Sphingomonas tagetis]|uniref:hypothetical protein n=1 Tax=Sphingomonas tagetis TaxID=2949092 RepID=UPI0020B6A591|nr:hypothetical protein [Sphingomonas tagetis]
MIRRIDVDRYQWPAVADQLAEWPHATTGEGLWVLKNRADRGAARKDPGPGAGQCTRMRREQCGPCAAQFLQSRMRIGVQPGIVAEIEPHNTVERYVGRNA